MFTTETRDSASFLFRTGCSKPFDGYLHSSPAPNKPAYHFTFLAHDHDE